MSSIDTIVDDSKKKFRNFIIDSWPTVYRLLNDFLSGTVKFLKETITSVFRSY
jgi:hypothetical protein